MLISMPTGTSTIFGVFQAILALLVKRTIRPPHKLARKQNFASEIFLHEALRVYAAPRNEITYLCAGSQNSGGSTGSKSQRVT
jgi:hypothetical protein